VARNTKILQPKKAIYVFWEGESEEAYAKFMSRRFLDSASIHGHREKGTFHTAQAYFRGNKRFKDDIKELDEIWFFFDTEVEKGGQWNEYMKCLKRIIASRRKNPVRIRLLMTSCCMEYWLLLHYEKTAPAMATPADKVRLLKVIESRNESYEKGNYIATAKIAEMFPAAIENGRWTLERLVDEGMPERTLDDTKERDEWLFQGTHTFTTVHEALEMLLSLPKLNE